MEMLIKILQVVIGLGFIVFVHELGHFLVAKWHGVRCESFSFGMGPVLLRWRPRYAWRPLADDFKYKAMLGPAVLNDGRKLRAALLKPHGGTVGDRLRMLPWKVEALAAGMVRVIQQPAEDGDPAKTVFRPELLDDAKITALKADPEAREVLVFDAGETEYRVSLLPIGGYVGMAGGEVPEEGNEPNPDEFLSKKPGQRAAILIAGVTMNIVTGFLMFILAFGIGVETSPNVVGDAVAMVETIEPAGTPSYAGVTPVSAETIAQLLGSAPPLDPVTTEDSGDGESEEAAPASGAETDRDSVDEPVGGTRPGPAWLAGLRTGDRIVGIATLSGDAPAPEMLAEDQDIDFTDVRIAVAFADKTDKVWLTILRFEDGERVRRQVAVQPVYNPTHGFMVIGVAQALNPVVATIADHRADALAGKLELGDLVVAVNGTELPLAFPHLDGEGEEDLDDPWARDYPSFQRLVREAGSGDLQLSVIRDGVRVQTTIDTYELPRRVRLGLDSTPLLPIRSVRPDGPAARATQAAGSDGGGWTDTGEPAPFTPGDTVIALNGTPVASFDELVREIQTLPAGEPARFTLARPLDRRVTRVDVFATPSANPASGELQLEFIVDTRVTSASAVSSLAILGVDPNGPASRAKLVGNGQDVPAGLTPAPRILPGDVLISVNDERVASWTEASAMLIGLWQNATEGARAKTAPAVRIQVARTLTTPDVADGEPRTMYLDFEIVPTAYGTDVVRAIGFTPEAAKMTRVYSGIDGIAVGLEKTWTMGQQVFLTLRSLLGGTVSPKNIGGPVMIAEASYKFAGWGLGTFIYFMAIISINLAIINILPIPLLDGGHLVFVAAEKIRGKPVPDRIQAIAAYIGLAMLGTLLLFVTFNDISRAIGW